jgi:hypothetical protein
MQSIIRHYNMTATLRRNLFFLNSTSTKICPRKIRNDCSVYITTENAGYDVNVERGG